MERQRTEAPPFPHAVESTHIRPVPGRVLVIDRDPAVRATIEALVMITGCEVQTAVTVSEGLVSIGRAAPGVIFLEGEIPFDEGSAAVQALRKAARWRVPVILVGEPHTRLEKILEVVAVEYLPKPFDARHLFSIIERHVSCPNLSRT